MRGTKLSQKIWGILAFLGWRLEAVLDVVHVKLRIAGEWVVFVENRGVDVVSKSDAGPQMRTKENESLRHGHFELIEIVPIATGGIGKPPRNRGQRLSLVEGIQRRCPAVAK